MTVTNAAGGLLDQIGRLELQHLDPTVRSSAALLNDLLADDFLEIGASGRVFDKAAIIDSLPRSPALESSLTGLVVRQLAPDIALATYRLSSRIPESSGDRVSLRSSLWVHRSNRWQLLFHQGTLTRGLRRPTREKGMPRSVFCRFEGGRLAVGEALELRDRTPRPAKLLFQCEECGQPVRAHRAGTTGQAAHFEHHQRNPKCHLSDHLR